MEFLPTLPVFLAFTFATFVLAITPGPDMTLFLGRALTRGRAAGIAALFGASSGIVIHTLLAAFGVSALLAASPTGFLILKIVGALYLLWLAIQALRKGSALTLEKQGNQHSSLFENWLAGLGVNLLNPKIVLFFITFLPQFVSPGDPNAAGKMVFLGLYFIVFSIVPMTVLIFTVDRLGEVLKRNRHVTRTIDWLFASVFGAFAVKMLLTERG